ncbi:MAG: YHYH protein [Candidatus Rariloculaceae bacterium]
MLQSGIRAILAVATSHKTHAWLFIIALASVALLAGCGGGGGGSAVANTAADDTTTPDDTTPPAGTGDVPTLFDDFNNDVVAYLDNDFVVVESTNVPDHGSPYFPITDTMYEAYSGTNNNYRQNPNEISTQDMTYRIPAAAAEAAVHEPTPLGPIGVAVNGVAIFNQYAGPNQPLTNEIDSFDQYNGHPQQSGQYHYHVEPLWITTNRGRDAMLGVLLDGFPVYGPMEFGLEIQETDLDEYHGHTSITIDSPDPIYHYHVTDQDPYINGNGFWGTAGTVTQ